MKIYQKLLKQNHIKITIKFITLVSVIALLTSCVKDESTVEGTLNYTGAVSGISYKAGGAYVSLFDEGLEKITYETTADDEGYYSFENVIDGKYHVYADITVNGFEYVGNSESFWVEGDEIHTENLQLEY